MVTFEAMRTEAEKIHDAAVMERVKNGIQLLERLHGPDWVDHIDMDTLQLRDASQCVLGQLYEREAKAESEKRGYELSGYDWGLANIPELCKIAGAIEYGFLVHGSDPWDTLQDAWESVLRPRVEDRG